MEWLFWLGILMAFYGYLGYGMLLFFLRRWGRPTDWQPVTPSLTLIIAAFNEEGILAQKLENTRALDYPQDQLEILVVADGSTDRTVEIAQRFGVRVEYLPERAGKSKAINRVVPLTRGEILVFSDANALYERDSLRKLAGHFHDPRVGAVSGEKRVEGPGVGSGEGLYWRYESTLKRWDSQLGSVMGAAGEIFAIRRELFLPLEGVVIEDFVLSMETVRRGYRVAYEPGAVATEHASSSVREEWKRKIRIAAGGWQAIFLLWPLLLPLKPLTWFQYVSHRVLRWTVIPLLLPLLLLESALLPGMLYRMLFFLQLGFYLLALVGFFRLRQGRATRGLTVPFYFLFFNLAALVGGLRFLRGWKPAVWEKAQRAQS